MIVVVALRTPHLPRILLALLIGGLITCIAIGAAVIHVLQRSALIEEHQRTTDEVVNLVCGILALLAAYALHRYRTAPGRIERPRKPKKSAEPPAWAERFIARGSALAFGAGIILNIVPGLVPIVAIADIAELDVSFAASLAILTIFYVMMFAFVEIPLFGYLFAPEWTTDAVQRFNVWLSENVGCSRPLLCSLRASTS